MLIYNSMYALLFDNYAFGLKSKFYHVFTGPLKTVVSSPPCLTYFRFDTTSAYFIKNIKQFCLNSKDSGSVGK